MLTEAVADATCGLAKVFVIMLPIPNVLVLPNSNPQVRLCWESSKKNSSVSNYAVVGLYFNPNKVVEEAQRN